MPQIIDHPEAPPLAVLRLLNGVLRGGEFALDAGATLFVARSPDALRHGAGQAEFPANAIFVPAEEAGGNFEVEVLQKEGETPTILVRDLDGAGEDEPYAPNTVRRIAGLDIAVRLRDEAWSSAVRDYGMQAVPASVADAASATGSVGATNADLQADRQPRPQPSRRSGKAWRIAGAVLLTASLAGAAAAMYWMQPASQRISQQRDGTINAIGPIDPIDALERKNRLTRAARLALSLHGADRYRVLPGRDGQMYIFAADERAAAWARQAVARGEEAGKARVLQKSEERVRIERLLDAMAPAYHTVRLGDPARPEIWLSQERASLTAAAAKALAQRITAALPYAGSVDIRFVADASVAAQAEAGLERLGVQHRRTDNGGSVTMSIRGALADGELQKIRSYVEAFYRQWGTHYVHYAIEMQDDFRKGKSFEYGSESYLKPAASHWDFTVQS